MKDTDDTEQTGADLLIACLEANGIDTAFGVPGEETTDLMRAIDRSSIDFVLCRHEQSAAFMASVHGRITGKPAVCLATLGPGATNLVTGVADATLDHAPLIALTGQGARNRLGLQSHQIIDLEALFQPVTKQSRTLSVPEEIPQAVAEAVRLSIDETPGAVHLCLPEDVAGMKTSGTAHSAAASPMSVAEEAGLQKAAKRIGGAERPVIVAGHGVVRAGAAKGIEALATHISAPVLTSFMAKGVMPADHPLCFHTVGQPQDDLADDVLSHADLIIAIGFDAVEYPPEALTRGGQIEVVHISETAPEANPGWPMAQAVLGELQDAVDRLRQALPSRALPDAFADVKTRIDASLAKTLTDPSDRCMAPQDICRVVSDALRPEDTVLSGVGLHKLWIARNLQARRPGQIIIPNGLAGMGLALPGTIAAARLSPKGRVIAICGDGDFLMNLQEMETAARLCLPVTVMVWEDGGLGLIDEKQSDGQQFAFGNPDWSALAQAFGWVFCDVTSFDQLEPALTAAAEAALPTLLRVRVDYARAGGMPGNAS
ncbi:acetolactate synthase large subunit [Aestuariivita boseongensis]|uniref:acetolactate synthase large subunit n=1 Tax=Aestuariivita boseongensis TaxID=1470562 RepID=UPI0006827E2D|nr:acetolactate synthase large subunit [Aestuariivita boseongensis]